jgi:serine/threonine-protein kinase
MSNGDSPEATAPDGTNCRVVLEVVEGLNRGARYEFDRHATFFIGRAKKAQLRILNDPHFSRHHCLVEVQPPRCYLRDLGSRNGTLLNGEPVAEAFLKEGDVFGGGKTQVRVGVVNCDPEQRREVSCLICSIRPSPTTVPLATLSATQYLCPACREQFQLDPPPVPGHELERRLGKGSLGATWYALRDSDDQPFAVKLIAPRAAVSDRVATQFLDEVRRYAEFDHPRVAVIHGQGQIDGQFYLIVDYVQTVDLRTLLPRVSPRRAMKAACGVICQALEALHLAHDRGLPHLDLKPSNVLVSRVDRKLRTTLTDFGLARLYENLGLGNLSRTGETDGSLPYMAPELVLDCRCDKPSADIYSMGATLYYFLSGFPPHVFASGRDAYATVLESNPVPLRERCPWVPPSLANLIAKSLDRKPRRRFRSAAEMFHAFLPYAQGQAGV